MSGSQRDRLLGRDDIERAFDALANRLEALGVRAHIYAVGGAVMSMAYRRSRLTMDVDALTIDHRETVLEAAAEVARELDLDRDWLNEDVRTKARVPVVPDGRAKVLYDSPYLVVTGASESHMLAMKVRAARAADEEDIKWLMKRVGVRTMAGLEDIHREVFPDSDIPPRCYERLGRLLREVREDDRRQHRLNRRESFEPQR